jgi:hypothetical protein
MNWFPLNSIHLSMKFCSALILFLSGFSLHAQDTLAGKEKPAMKIVKGLTLFPIEKQIGYRSNLNKKWFTDFKGGMTYSALPFFVLEINRCRRFVMTQSVNVYSGVGLTFDSYVPGIQCPIGMEVVPLKDVPHLSVIAEVAPKMTFGPTNFLNITFSPHVGLCYYMKEKPMHKKQAKGK